MIETPLPGMPAPPRPPISDDWVLWRKCGCPQGVAVVSAFPAEDDAWEAFYETWKEIAKAIQRGEHLEQMTHERYVREVTARMSVRCEHEQAVVRS